MVKSAAEVLANQSIMISAFKAAAGMDTLEDAVRMKMIHIEKRLLPEIK